MTALSTAPAALFDMDGLLLDSERAYLTAFLEVQAQMGLTPDRDLFLSCVGVRSAETDGLLRAAFPVDVPVAEFRTLWDARVADLLSGEIARRPQVEVLLTRLKSAGIAMGVATSTRHDVARGRLERSGLSGFFDVLVGGDEVTNPKPDPEIYLLLAQKMGVDISVCVAFEDSNPGTLAGVASGARVVQVPDLTVPTAQIIALGHVIADDVLAGAIEAGLLPA